LSVLDDLTGSPDLRPHDRSFGEGGLLILTEALQKSAQGHLLPFMPFVTGNFIENWASAFAYVSGNALLLAHAFAGFKS